MVSSALIAQPAFLVVLMCSTDTGRLITADATLDIRHIVASQQPNRHIAIVGGDPEPAMMVVALNDSKRQFCG